MDSPLLSLEPEIAAGLEQVEVEGQLLLAYPPGRHAHRAARPRTLTVAVPLRNAAGALRRLLDSLAAQDDRDFDVALVDNGSTDETFAIACQEAAARDNVVAYRNPADIGRVPNWNRCLELPGGPLVKLLMANDRLDPAFVRRMKEPFEEDADVVLARCTLVFIGADGTRNVVDYFPTSRTLTGEVAFRRGLLQDNLAAGPSAQVFRRSALEQGPLRFDPAMPWAADYALALQLLGRGDFAFVQAPLMTFDSALPRFFNSAGLVTRFRDECLARLAGAEAWPHALPPALLAGVAARFASLLDEFWHEPGAAEARGGLVEAYADASRWLADLAQARLPAELDGAGLQSMLERTGDQLTAASSTGDLVMVDGLLRRMRLLDPWRADLLASGATIRARLGDRATARKQLFSALELDPGNTRVLEQLRALEQSHATAPMFHREGMDPVNQPDAAPPRPLPPTFRTLASTQPQAAGAPASARPAAPPARLAATNPLADPLSSNNRYTAMQRKQYEQDADLMNQQNHMHHNANQDYWDILVRDTESLYRDRNGLDFGCGCGRNVMNLWYRFARMDGVDISQGNLQHAQENALKAGCPPDRVKFIHCSGVDLGGLKDQEYDFIMSTIVLQHIAVHDIRLGYMKEFFRVMRPGGLLSFQMGFGDSYGKAGYYENHFDAEGTNSLHDTNVTDPEQICSELRDLGFTNVVHTIRPSFSDRHAAWIFVKALKPAPRRG